MTYGSGGRVVVVVWSGRGGGRGAKSTTTQNLLSH